ncbi:Rho GTPase activating protein [Entomophthora muscae]|uniref:Rho GTPase activating protein n=1 Tax=Entomophthora muscae TaxID=34485 RepID=A0ACC2TVV2_9FUNG|nr:Rho GTPase activating protein [Entomophthora muscae]
MAAVDMSPFLSPLPSDEELDDDCDDQSPKTYLQKVLSERNNLRAQNSQLWKIIQKQRIIIQQLQKTLSGRDSKSPEEESDLSVSQPSPPRKDKYPQETSEENSSRSENNPHSTLEELESPPKRSVEKEGTEKPTKGRRASTTIQKLEATQADGSTSKEDKQFKRRSKTMSAAFRESPASEKPPDSKKSSKESKKRRSKEINAALKDSLDAVQAENLVIEDSPAPEKCH